jgi:stage V sporulation protein G
LNEDRLIKDEDGRAKLYADIAHPINSACREMIQQRVIREFQTELERAKLPGYRSRYDDYDAGDVDLAVESPTREQRQRSGAKINTQVQPAEQQPRSPHKLPSQQSVPHTPHSGSAQPHASQDKFGAGIF